MMFCQLKLNGGQSGSNLLLLMFHFNLYVPFLSYGFLDNFMDIFSILCRYQEYKASYIEAQKRSYFDAHKDEDW